MIYLDTPICVYALENDGDVGERIRALLAGTDATFCISPLVVMECLVGPFRRADSALENSYRRFFTTLETVLIKAGTWERAARLRGTVALGAADALHLAAAQDSGCSSLWTSDVQFVKRSGGFAEDVTTAQAA
jgi:predicted nucleic acid-binding protein